MFGKPEVFVSFAAKKIDEKTARADRQPTKDIIKQQLAAFAKFIKRVKVLSRIRLVRAKAETRAAI